MQVNGQQTVDSIYQTFEIVSYSWTNCECKRKMTKNTPYSLLADHSYNDFVILQCLHYEKSITYLRFHKMES